MAETEKKKQELEIKKAALLAEITNEETKLEKLLKELTKQSE